MPQAAVAEHALKVKASVSRVHALVRGGAGAGGTLELEPLDLDGRHERHIALRRGGKDPELEAKYASNSIILCPSRYYQNPAPMRRSTPQFSVQGELGGP
jgi:hypothetical protein